MSAAGCTCISMHIGQNTMKTYTILFTFDPKFLPMLLSLWFTKHSNLLNSNSAFHKIKPKFMQQDLKYRYTMPIGKIFKFLPLTPNIYPCYDPYDFQRFYIFFSSDALHKIIHHFQGSLYQLAAYFSEKIPPPPIIKKSREFRALEGGTIPHCLRSKQI